jgi:hypothetical protein
MIKFEERASAMGLACNDEKGTYSYVDTHGGVMYRTIQTTFPPEASGIASHVTDGFQPPYLSLFTKRNGDDTHWQYCGIVSKIYKFVGNEVLNERVRNSILGTGLPIIRENTIISYDLTRMRNEIVIQNGVNNLQYGDILPVMIINNSYNGSKAQSIQFGLSMNYNEEVLSFAFKLGEMKQIHITGATTTLSSDVGEYMEVFTGNILDMINDSFNHRLTEEQLFMTLDVVGEIGKKRREGVSKLLTELAPEVPDGTNPPLPTAWQVFLAVTRYSSFEPNLNAKSLLENAAESVLVIPVRMMDVLEKINEEA